MTAEHVEAIVIGSGAGGGIVGARLGEAGVRTVVLEAGGLHRAGSFDRFELRAAQNLWNPPRFADTGGPPIVMVSGKGVGGSTNINTKVGVRAIEQDYRKWHEATGLTGDDGAPFDETHLGPYYARTESRMKVRPRADWTESVRVVERGFEAMGASLHPVTSYTDHSCESCGSCTAGCPTNAGSTTLNRYLDPAVVTGTVEVRPGSRVTRIVTEDAGGGRRRATGVEYTDADGVTHHLVAPIVVVAAGTLVTPQLLQLSGLAELGTSSSALIGRHLGTHTSRMIHGVFPQIMDAHVVYPITAHCKDFAADEDGGFVVECTTVMDPIGLASNLVDEQMRPLWGRPLADAMDAYRHLAGLFLMTNDSNVGTITATEDLTGEIAVPVPPEDAERLAAGFRFCSDVLRAAGAQGVVATGYITSHVQGSVRMGSDRERSACDPHQQLWDVDGLYVGDGSVIPRTLTFNPSLTIFALAERLADHLVERAGGGRVDRRNLLATT